jgi:ABC-type phosphate transport system substrate-binding protein
MKRRFHQSRNGRARAVARWLALLAFAVLGWAHRSEAEAIELLVIINSSNPESRLSESELRAIFLTKKRAWGNGQTIDPVNLPEKTPQRRDFDKAVLGFDPDAAARYWIDRKVRGDARPPKRMPSPSAALAHVANNPGGIAYVPKMALGAGIKVVARVANGQVRPP